ncbi:MAG: hypothetical protein ACP5OR_08055 [Candidatus Dormibacteria bacterium]
MLTIAFMSEIAGQARELVGRLVGRDNRSRPPSVDEIDGALDSLNTLAPRDMHDEMVLSEVGEMLMRLRDVAASKPR